MTMRELKPHKPATSALLVRVRCPCKHQPVEAPYVGLPASSVCGRVASVAEDNRVSLQDRFLRRWRVLSDFTLQRPIMTGFLTTSWPVVYRIELAAQT